MARRNANALVHHVANRHDTQLEIFRKLTVDSALLTDADSAPAMIDRVLASCVALKRPVYLELPMDVAKAPCARPPATPPSVAARASDPKALEACVAEVAARLDAAKNPVVLVGTEISRFRLGAQALQLIERIELPFAVTVSAKGSMPEMHPQCLGVYQGGLSHPAVQKQVEEADLLLELGGWRTDWDTGLFTAAIDPQRNVRANLGEVQVAYSAYDRVQLEDFLRLLAERAKARDYRQSHPARPSARAAPPAVDRARALGAEHLYRRIEHFLDDSMVLVADVGDILCAVAEMHIDEPDNFVMQGYYMSIGYATPAGLGVSMARPDKRAVILAGDGAFQMTAQEISTLVRNRCNTIVVLLNNDGYLIERYLHEDGAYNDVQPWRYADLPKAFGGDVATFRATTEGELDEALAAARATSGRPVFIEAIVGRDPSAALKRMGETYQKNYKKPAP
jgi:indolepyruvate decarboxylase